MSNEKRFTPQISSTPTVASTRPRQPEIRPLSTFLPEAPAMMLRPNTQSEKYSGARKLRATLASWGAIRSRHRPLKRPPATEATTAMPSAFPACPFWAIG